MNSPLLLLLILCTVVSGGSTTDPQARLAELPLGKLLNVKQALASDISRLLDGTNVGDEDDVKVEVEEDESMDGGPMPLKGDWFQQKKTRAKPTKLPDRRGDWDYDKGEKKGDLSKVFQTTVTVLAFLAFGGYLLCVILMAFRNNQGFFQLFPTTAPTAAPTARVPTAGRRRREAFPVLDTPFVLSLTESLHRLAEGYAKYHFSEGRDQHEPS
uniref:Protein translocase subunit SecA 2 n=2 Tax=Lygus hesperus TaxID=30085 RepID=A0A0A9Z8F1_LYGHE